MKKIGVLIQKSESIFVNGCFQQAYFTMKALKKCGYDVILITADDDYTKFDYPQVEIRKIAYDGGWQDIDMVLFVSAFSDDNNILKLLKSKNIKIVNQIGGNYFILTQEQIIFDVHNRNFFIANDYIDEVWLLPMYSFMKSYLEVMGKRPVKVVPYVWDSEIIDEYCLQNKIDIRYNKNQNNDKITLVIMEPNMSIHKTCMVPLVISEAIDRKYHDRISKVLCFCPPDNKNFAKFANSLDIYKNSKLEFYPRMIMPSVLNMLKKFDTQIILISHNILNNLNFLPMEYLHLGYPVIHNSEPYCDVGYFYPNQDIHKGLECFERIINEHNKSYESDKLKIKKKLQKFNPESQKNVNEYVGFLDNLFKNNEIENNATNTNNQIKLISAENGLPLIGSKDSFMIDKKTISSDINNDNDSNKKIKLIGGTKFKNDRIKLIGGTKFRSETDSSEKKKERRVSFSNENVYFVYDSKKNKLIKTNK